MNNSFTLPPEILAPLPAVNDADGNSDGRSAGIIVLAGDSSLTPDCLAAMRALREQLPAPVPSIRDGGTLDDWQDSDAPKTRPARVLILVHRGIPHGRVHRLMMRARKIFASPDIIIKHVERTAP